MAGRRRGVAAGNSGVHLIDEAVLTQMVVDLGPEAVAEVCAVFLVDGRRAIHALRSACEAGDGGEVGGTAHRLKSASAFLGVFAVSTLCAEIEDLARDGRLEEAASRVEFVSEALNVVSGQLPALVERLTPEATRHARAVDHGRAGRT